MMPGRTLKSLGRRIAMLPLRALDADTRAEALAHLTAGAVVHSSAAGREIAFFAPSPLLRSRADSMLTKEPDTIAWLDTVGRDDVLWDVGANVGVYALYAGVVRQCRVLAFEPSAANFYVLARNIHLNDLGDRVAAYCVALAGATGLGFLNLDSMDPGTAMSQFGRAGDASRYSTASRPATHGMVGFTIDDFITRFAPPFPTHLKIDVDGLEWPILQGATATLADRRLRSMVVELSLSNTAERDRAVAWLQRHGLRLISRGASQGAAGEVAANHLFAREA